MTKEQKHLMNAQEQLNEYSRHIDEAMSAADPGEMKEHVREAMPFGQKLLDSLEEALNIAEDPDLADEIEEAMHHAARSMEQGDQAEEVSEDEIEDIVSEMRKHAQESASYLNQAMGITA